MNRMILLTCCFASLLLGFPPPTMAADEEVGLSQGQTIYVPAYSHIYHGSKERPFLLAVTLSIRNIDPNQSIVVTVVDYYETEGRLLTKYVDSPVVLNPWDPFAMSCRNGTRAVGREPISSFPGHPTDR